MNLHYRKFGKGEPIVILHGLFGTSDNWQTVGKILSNNFQIFLVDLRNHGHSPHCDVMDYYAMSEDLFALFNNEKINNAIIIGHSMGAKVAMFFTQEHREFVHKLVVVDMGIKKYAPHHQIIFDALFAVDLNKIHSRKEAEMVIRSFFNDESVIQFLLKNLYWQTENQLAWRMNLPVLYREIDHILAPVPNKIVTVNTLFIRGGKSNYIVDDDWSEILTVFPNAVLKTIEKAGHWVHAEAFNEFLQILNDFIN